MAWYDYLLGRNPEERQQAEEIRAGARTKENSVFANGGMMMNMGQNRCPCCGQIIRQGQQIQMPRISNVLEEISQPQNLENIGNIINAIKGFRIGGNLGE